MDYSIRKATPDDNVNLAALSIQVWLHNYASDGLRSDWSKYVLSRFTPAYFDQLLDDAKRCILVALSDDLLVGYITANLESVWNDDTNGYEIETLYIQEHFHGRGIGRQLLKELEARCGVPYWLHTWVHNRRARRIYQQYGFKDVGRTDFEIDGEQHENRVLVYKPQHSAE